MSDEPSICKECGKEFAQLGNFFDFAERLAGHGNILEHSSYLCPDCMRPFPINPRSTGKTIPWWVARRVYKEYSRRYGTDQSLERLAERGGFGEEELDDFYPQWRDDCQ